MRSSKESNIRQSSETSHNVITEQAGPSTSESVSSTTEKKWQQIDNEVLNTEFIYYSSVLRLTVPVLSKKRDRSRANSWVQKLYRPEYHSTALKPKRNRYLLYLTITLYNDETYGIFQEKPPFGVLAEIDKMPSGPECDPALWESETQWQETLDHLPDELLYKNCYLHQESGCPPINENLSNLLDTTFHYFLYLSRPYVSLMTDSQDKIKAACWIQALCAVAPGEEDCIELKSLRNDYMQALLGYVHELRVAGPFCELPPLDSIQPLSKTVEDSQQQHPFSDPSGPETEEFLAGQPFPENGAFAYINMTGDLFQTNV